MLSKLCFKTKLVQISDSIIISIHKDRIVIYIIISDLFILQVQIYELEEHKIETWRGFYNMQKKRKRKLSIYVLYVWI